MTEIGPSTILNKLHGRSATVGNIHDLRDHIIAHAGASGVTYPVAGIDAVATSPVIYYALSVALHGMRYNFADIYKTLRTSPAMAAGIEDKLWPVADIVALTDTALKSN